MARLAPREPSQEPPFRAWSFGVEPSGRSLSRTESVLGKKLLRFRDGSERFAWECQDPAEKGRSGGGLFDASGRLLGVCSGISDGRSYFTHRDEIEFWLRKSDYAWLLKQASPRKVGK